MGKQNYNRKDGKNSGARRGEHRNSEPKSAGRVTSKCNDWNWYVPNEQLLKDVASFSFANMLGNTFTISDSPNISIETQANRIPGIMRIAVLPSLGGGTTATDAATVAARRIYTYVRHANSGHANYEAPDLLMYIVAHANAQACICDMVRAYSTMLHYTPTNRYMARALVDTLGYDYDNISANMSGFRSVINIAISKLNSLKTPGGMPLVARWKWISSNIYTDETSTKPQIYFTRFAKWLKFDATTSPNGSSLQWVPRHRMTAGNGITVDEAQRVINELLDPLLSDEDIGIMSGDIMKAYSTYSDLPYLAENTMLIPSTVDIVSEQFHNIRLCGKINPAPITQSADGTILNPQVYNTANGSESEQFTLADRWLDESAYFLDLPTDKCSPEYVMVASRLAAAFENRQEFETHQTFDVYTGTEVATSIQIYNNPSDMESYWNIKSERFPISDYVGALRYADYTSSLAKFNRGPRLFGVVNTTDGKLNYRCFSGEVDNFTTMPNGILKNIHKVAVLNELLTTSGDNLK